MPSCKDCLCVDMCYKHKDISDGKKLKCEYFDEDSYCDYFKDRTRFVELPCKVGDDVYATTEEEICKYRFISIAIVSVNEKNDMFLVAPEDFGKECFLSKEEAEQALKERENNVNH